MSTALKKGQKVYVIRMGRGALCEVVKGTVTQVGGGPGSRDDTVFVRIPFEYDGKQDTIVSDQRPENVFRKEKDALINASRRCHEIARKWDNQAIALMEQATVKK